MTNDKDGFQGTPGPWVLMRSGNGYPYQIEDRNGKGITKWGGISAPMSPSSEHNALLIAAAPDLLDALIDALSCIERTVEYYDPAIDKSRAAIAKALGQ